MDRQRLHTLEVISSGSLYKPRGRLIWGDNFEVMRALLDEGYGGRFKLIYIDPPFGTETHFKRRITTGSERLTIKQIAYSDRWSGRIDRYLDMLYPRLELMRELLRDDGVIFVHCDWRTGAYIRVLMDDIFGRRNFLNEIIWHYGGRGAKAVSGQFPRNHDTILVFGRTRKASLKKVFMERRIPVGEAGRYGYRMDGDGRYFKTSPRGDYTEESIKRLEKEGRIYRTRTGRVRIKYFIEKRGDMLIDRKLVGDVWDDIPDCMHNPPLERTAYGTQKPEALLVRIIEAGSEETDLVGDFFSGSGTTACVAERLGRRWIVCEKGQTGIYVTRGRLMKIDHHPFTLERPEGEWRNTPSRDVTSRVTIEGPSITPAGNGSVEVSITLKDYRLLRLPGGVSMKDPSRLFDMAGRDFTVLVESWSVDWDYDGRVFRGRSHSIKEGPDSSIDTTMSSVLEAKKRTIAVHVVDIFGNRTGVEICLPG